MIHFKDDSFIIEVKTGINPVEDWIDTQLSIIEVLQAIDKNQISEDAYYRLLVLAREMLPDIKIMNRMENKGSS